jgi:nitrate reductase beta subunit
MHGYINHPDDADVGDPREEVVNPIDFMVHEKEIAKPLYPQFGLEPNVYYIPPITAPVDYLTQMFGPGVEEAIETYQAARNGEEPEIQALLHLIGSTEWSLTGFEIDGDEAVGYYEGDEVGRVPITEPTAERDRYDFDREEREEQERPPMITLDQYRDKHNRDLPDDPAGA